MFQVLDRGWLLLHHLYCLTSSACCTHSKWKTLWGVFSVNLSCSCFTDHQKHCFSHQALGLALFASVYVTLCFGQCWRSCLGYSQIWSKYSNIIAQKSLQVTHQRLWHARRKQEHWKDNFALSTPIWSIRLHWSIRCISQRIGYHFLRFSLRYKKTFIYLRWWCKY